ncbi:hypothetical protein LSH36_816g00015 [Paralvinella palmiformis]|uniref:Uncharacterized protein n=1 Tax=Paralvinella palmiformis TaxID=53620 RepID=A0AAD9J167_9ANNE|nr:hypothetical protein LSH36_816g00015 [Paralvinella palmiformis]
MCTTCSRPSDVTIINTVGTFISTKQSCFHCMYSQVWSSQSKINRIPAGNLLLSAAISFSGSLYTKVLRLMKSMNVLMIGESTFQEHATMYQHPVIWNVWQSQQQQLISQLRDMQGSLVIGGDGRANTPGHCAKYGQYTMMELRLNKIADFQLVQSNEVGGSNLMETEGLVRAVEQLKTDDLEVGVIVTDRHPQIQKWLREELPSVTHYYDMWQKDIHENHSPLYQMCHHRPSNKQWMKQSSKACEELVSLIETKRLLKDMSKLSPLHQTSSVEAFHSVVLQFAPKLLTFGYKGMLARVCLASMHYNENQDRLQAHNKQDKAIYTLKYPKLKRGGHTVQKRKQDATFEYVDELMPKVFEDPRQYWEVWDQIIASPSLVL